MSITKAKAFRKLSLRCRAVLDKVFGKKIRYEKPLLPITHNVVFMEKRSFQLKMFLQNLNQHSYGGRGLLRRGEWEPTIMIKKII